MSSILLYLTAILLGIIIIPLGLLFGFIQALYKRQWKLAPGRIKYKFLKMAEGIDCYGNIVCAELFNATLIRTEGYSFGNRKETISSVLGKNEAAKTLTSTGRIVCRILNSIQKDHSKISIDNHL